MSGSLETAVPTGAIARPLATSARRGALALLDQGVVSAASFASGLLVGRMTSPAEFGRYTVALTVVLLLTEIQTSLVATPYTVARPRLSGSRLAAYTGDAMLLQLGIAAVAALVLAAIAPFLAPGAAGLAAMVAVALVPLLLRDHLRRLSFAGFDMRRALRLDLLVVALQLAALVALAVTGRLTAATAFAATGGAAACGAIAWWIRRRDEVRLSPAGAVEALPEMWRAGRWVLASGVAWALGLYAYPWLLAGLRGSGAAGMWAAGMGLASLANPVLLGLGNYLAPESAHAFATGGSRGLGSMVMKACGVLTLLMLPLSAAALLFGERLVALAYGSAYGSSGLLVFLLSLHLWMSALAFPVSRGLFALGRADLELRANLVGLGVLAAFGVWLVWVYGPEGAALGLSLSGAASNLARAWWMGSLLREEAP